MVGGVSSMRCGAYCCQWAPNHCRVLMHTQRKNNKSKTGKMEKLVRGMCKIFAVIYLVVYAWPRHLYR